MIKIKGGTVMSKETGLDVAIRQEDAARIAFILRCKMLSFRETQKIIERILS